MQKLFVSFGNKRKLISLLITFSFASWFVLIADGTSILSYILLPGLRAREKIQAAKVLVRTWKRTFSQFNSSDTYASMLNFANFLPSTFALKILFETQLGYSKSTLAQILTVFIPRIYCLITLCKPFLSDDNFNKRGNDD